MKPEIKLKWTTALRSGKYKQGRSRLQRLDAFENPQFCCLGVLCDLYIQETGNGKWQSGPNGPNMPVIWIGSGFSGLRLPREVREWAGISSADPTVMFVTKTERAVSLSSLNDGMGFSFDKIADVIDEQL